LLEAVNDAELFIASLRPENVGSALHANLNEELQAAQHAYRVHVADADVIEEWLAREDPALYAAAKKARGCNTSGCGCHSYDRYETSMREWIDSLSQTKV
jgi:hypothetical protein